MERLRVAALQLDLKWQDPPANRRRIEDMLGTLHEPADMILLPEMFTTGFTMEAASYAEEPEGETLDWMIQQAREHRAVVGGSIIVQEDGRYFNRFMLAGADELLAEYDKRHLFRLAGEHEAFARGEAWSWYLYKGWRVVPMICYDLRFPVWSRNRADKRGQLACDLLIYVANWPSPRIRHWEILLQARAIENQCFVIGLNRVGTDGKGLHYPGASLVVDPRGEVLARGDDSEMLMQVVLDPAPMLQYREDFPVWMDADTFELYL
ncbi:MAG: amidohydrolase [Bacteroidia bacterium]